MVYKYNIYACTLLNWLRKVLSRYLEALSVDNGGSRFIIFLLGDPHLLEGGERGQDGATDPYGVLPLGRSNDLDLHGGGGQILHLLFHTVSNTWKSILVYPMKCWNYCFIEKIFWNKPYKMLQFHKTKLSMIWLNY